MNKTKVSVIMPVYNGEKYLADSIESILNQSYADFEFIIIDDASTDNSYKIISGYQDRRIKLLSNDPNIGQTITLNKGIQVSASGFIARMDQDDIALPQRLKLQLDFLIRHPEIALVGSSATIINGLGKKIGLWPSVREEGQLRIEVLFNNPIAHSSVMLRREALASAGYYSEDFIFAQDYDLWSRMLICGYRITNMPEPLISFRVHDSSATVRLHASRFYIETGKIIKNNLNSIAGINISASEAEKICKSMYSPELLNQDEFECAGGIFDAVFKKMQTTGRYCPGIFNKAIAKFKHIYALSCIARKELPNARSRLLDSFRTYPMNIYPLAYWLYSFLDKEVVKKAKIVKSFLN